MCDIGSDLERWSVWKETPRMARKEHICVACSTRIQSKTAYCSFSYVYEGSATTEKMCFECWWTWDSFSSSHGFTMAPSYLEENLRECIGEDDDWRPELAGLLSRWRSSPEYKMRFEARSGE